MIEWKVLTLPQSNVHCNVVLCVSGTKLHLGTVDFCVVWNERKIDSSVKLNTVLEMSTIVV